MIQETLAGSPILTEISREIRRYNASVESKRDVMIAALKPFNLSDDNFQVLDRSLKLQGRDVALEGIDAAAVKMFEESDYARITASKSGVLHRRGVQQRLEEFNLSDDNFQLLDRSLRLQGRDVALEGIDADAVKTFQESDYARITTSKIRGGRIIRCAGR